MKNIKVKGVRIFVNAYNIYEYVLASAYLLYIV